MNNFDSIAPVYDALAKVVFWGGIERANRFFLSEIPSGSRMLIVGGGSGKILEDLAELYDDLQIVYVESSKGMIDRAKQRKSGVNQITFVHASFPQVTIQPQEFDVVMGPFFFDLFDAGSLLLILETVRYVLKHSGLLLVSDFRMEEKRGWHRWLSWSMHGFFRCVAKLQSEKLRDLDTEIISAGFAPKKQRCFYGKFIFAAVYQYTGNL
ncbi:class I SAM-dependent methyltransferase [Reichenbachiella sp. 5M10]|uniref:class I SAM-dependent methyltransferase n=1 Tax=Reichenbachiella sp. 5M10 TaxID=1889772 RepID=UPI000C14E1BA|nr:class I SAM-dependent methyltransferase [Reichenbachiella sp. 5M10]